jgi:Mrp family chromosome partitioning ATPase/uncharacterized protein involved in exopolysaccharide biosynthesis
LPGFRAVIAGEKIASGLNQSRTDAYADGSARAGLTGALIRRAPIVVGLLVAALLVGALYVFALPRTYTAVSTLQVKPQGAGFDGEAGSELVRAQKSVLKSAEVLNLAASDERLAGIPMLERLKDPVRYLQSNLRVDARGEGVFNVSLAGSQPEQLTKAVDLVVDAYRSYQKAEGQDRVQAHLKEIAEQRAPVETEVKKLKSAVDDLLRQDATLRLDPEKSPVAQKLATLADAHAKAQLETIDQRAAYESLRARGGEFFEKVTEDELNAALRGEGAGDSDVAVAEEMRMLEQKLVDLRRTYLPNHPAVVRVNDRMKQLKLMQLASARNRWKGAEKKEQLIKTELDDANNTAVAASARLGEYVRANASLRSAETRLAELDRAKDAARDGVVGLVEVTRIHGATVEDDRYPPAPQPAPTLAIAALIGLGLGIGGALIQEWRSTGTLRHAVPLASASSTRITPETIGLPVLASVPPIDEPGGVVALAWSAQIDPQGRMARAIRQLRRGVEVQGQLPATLALSAPARTEGTTSVAANLAGAIAREGRRVLLIDACFASPKLHEVYSIAEPGGFCELLGGGEPASLVRSTRIPGLDVLVNGEPTSDPASMLNTERFGELISTLTAAYDHVIFDCDAVSTGDAPRIIASLADVTVLVARSRVGLSGAASGANPDRRRAIAQARDALMMLGAHVLGVVVTGDVKGTARTAAGAGAAGTSELPVVRGNDDAAAGFFREANDAKDESTAHSRLEDATEVTPTDSAQASPADAESNGGDDGVKKENA